MNTAQRYEEIKEYERAVSNLKMELRSKINPTAIPGERETNRRKIIWGKEMTEK